MILQIFESISQRYEKCYHRGTSLVPTKHLWRPRCLQIIKRRLFLSLYCMKDKRLYCSQTNLKRDLGLYDREQVSVNLLSYSVTVIVRSFSLRDYSCCILRLKHTKFCLCFKKKKNWRAQSNLKISLNKSTLILTILVSQ